MDRRRPDLTLQLDHIIWAAPDLGAACDLFARITGVSPGIGGSHPGFGTRNALVSLSQSSYFEVLAPDPAQDLSGNWGAQVAQLSRPEMFGFALQSANLEQTADRVRSAGVTCHAPLDMSRQLASGEWLRWRIMRMEDPRWPERLPFFIDWQGAPSPGTTTPEGCRLQSFQAIAPDPGALREVFEAIGCTVPVLGGARFGYVAELETLEGPVLLT